MCLALYIGAERELPLIEAPHYTRELFESEAWPREAQRFHVAALGPNEEAVRARFSVPVVVYVGSYEGCGCGFNEGREYPPDSYPELYHDDDAEGLRAARESVEELVRYLGENQAKEIYSCWSGDESQPAQSICGATLKELGSPSFFFAERQLITIAPSVG